jgi:hypothetical protein
MFQETDMNLQSVPGHDFDTVSRKHVYEKNVFVGQVFPKSTLLHGSWAMVCSTVETVVPAERDVFNG